MRQPIALPVWAERTLTQWEGHFLDNPAEADSSGWAHVLAADDDRVIVEGVNTGDLIIVRRGRDNGIVTVTQYDHGRRSIIGGLADEPIGMSRRVINYRRRDWQRSKAIAKGGQGDRRGKADRRRT